MVEGWTVAPAYTASLALMNSAAEIGETGLMLAAAMVGRVLKRIREYR